MNANRVYGCANLNRNSTVKKRLLVPIYTPNQDFIDLNRTFHELSEHAGQSDDVDLSQVFRVKSQLTWVDVHKNPRTVVLSEAGSGKTQEIRHVAMRLRAAAKPAFFLRLELIPDDFDVAFEVGTMEEFENWLASDDAGWLLLDSVDEARLKSPQDFERAIRKLGRRINNAKSRVTIVLTGRTHAWRPKTDLELCEKHIGFPPQTKALAAEPITDLLQPDPDNSEDFDEILEIKDKKEDVSPRFKVVALDDLSRNQVAAFAAAKGVQDVIALQSAIERADAWSSTARPQDLDEVTAMWLETGRIGTRLEIMNNSIDRRISERDQMRAEARPITDERIREGVMLLAAGTTLAQSQIIRVPDGAENGKGISPKSVLSGWTDVEVSTLLSRPIFDDAIYGTVRFHHRSVREYLSARWIVKLLERPTSRRAIEALLFRKQYGLDVVVPTMRPVLPWLAIFDDRIRERVRAIAPEVIFEGGDPSALPLPTRQEILSEVCNRLANDRILHSATAYDAVQWFAQPDIADDIQRLLKQYASNDEVVGFLVRMVWLGQLKALSADVKKVALSPTISRYTRISAFRAVREVGNESDRQDVRDAFLKEATRLNREWLGELITDLEPSKDTITWVLDAVGKSEDKERYSVDRLTEAVEAFCRATSLELLPLLLSGIAKLLEQPPFIERGYCEVSQQFSWLMKIAAHGVERLIQARDAHSKDSVSLEIVRNFGSLRTWGDDVRDVRIEFSKLIQGWEELNDASFWHDIATTRVVVARKKGERLTDYWSAQVYGAFWQFGLSDFDRVCGWARSRSDQDDRPVALSLAFTIYVQNGKSRELRAKLKSICVGNSELEARLEQLLTPSPENIEYKKQEQRWKRQAAARTKKQAEQFEKEKAYVLGHVDLIRDPKFPQPSDLSRLQWYLHQKIREKSNGTTKWTDGRWRELIPIFGEPVAEAYRDGAMAYWRKYKPVLRSEGGRTANQTPGSVIFGLSGLGIEFGANADHVRRLDGTEAELASRYALDELNGFPNWFQTLFEVHRDTVRKTVLGEIEWELKTGEPDKDTNYVLSDISWSGQWAWDDLAPDLFALLEAQEPKNGAHLHQLLKIIQGSQISDAQIAQLAKRRIASVAGERLADWYAVWVGVSPDLAIPSLERHFASISDDKDRTEFAMRFITKLWGSRDSESFGARSAFVTPKHLLSLYFAMHEYIRASDDIDRADGGVYSPELRDHAQNARNRILQELIKIPGKDAFLALQAIAEKSQQTPSYGYLELQSKQKAEQDADLKPWTPEAVKEFNDRLDRIPSTHRELADLAVLRLLDLKDDLEEGDDSVAAVVKKITEETMLRNYIGHELRQKASGRYSIPQEEELADAKKPDLRFHAIAIDAPVPCELKIADKWTGPSLFERLEQIPPDAGQRL
jgi:hypothetical protein